MEMEDTMIKSFKFLFMMMLIFVLLGSSFAFAASNVVDPSNVGYGNDDTGVTGYTINGIVYKIDTAANPNLTEVDLVATPQDTNIQPAMTVRIRLTAGTTWYNCTEAPRLNPDEKIVDAVCMIPDVTAEAVSTLDVIAISSDDGVDTN
jgi:hypothetical protein